MKPINDRVLIKIDNLESMCGLLFLPEGGVQRAITSGTVLELGSGEWLLDAQVHKEFEVSVGDRVIFSSMAGAYIDDTKTQCVVRECDLLAVIDKKTSLTKWNKYNVQSRDIEVV